MDSRELSVLDRDELFDLLKEVIVDVTPSQVNHAIDDYQSHSTHGQLDFDEFLYTLAEMEKPTDEEDKEEEQQEKDGQTTDRKERKSKNLYNIVIGLLDRLTHWLH